MNYYPEVFLVNRFGQHFLLTDDQNIFPPVSLDLLFALAIMYASFICAAYLSEYRFGDLLEFSAKASKGFEISCLA